MLFDSRSKGTAQVYKGLYGEDVKASGIVFLTPKSEIGLLAKNIYARTGVTGDEADRGDIVLDASKGHNAVNVYGSKVSMFIHDSVDIWHSPQDEAADPRARSPPRARRDLAPGPCLP